ncbi:uncharacterized protein [Maniola hyperantus]|uniref:uncharacterized protein n=1 Tax=Aphantopus hyperantus TaxID=2795564 RepID=UPI003749FD43
MKKLMDFYNNIIIAYDYLNDAVKWQVGTLLFVLLQIFDRNNALVYGVSMIVIQVFPVLVPCVFADRIQKEVRLIKDFLACKLYENTLDKPSRSTARTLLALIETRNLSFSLFHMFDIDISLPFKFMALLLTYLIILLQFDKVISPKKSAKL